MQKFYDSNALLNLQEKAFVKDECFLISDITLKEIENIKTSLRKDEEIKYKARKLSKLLKLHRNDNTYKIIMQGRFKRNYKLWKNQLEKENDNIIIIDALSCNHKDMVFVTDDTNCYNIATNLGLKVDDLKDDDKNIYKGYRLLKGNTVDINEALYNPDSLKMNVNEYLVIYNTDDDTEREMRFDGENFVKLNLPDSRFIKGKNALQRCALDMLTNPNITTCAILGGYGSGKTYVAMQMALYAVEKKGNQSSILGVREVLGEGKDIGFLPGDLQEKVGNFFLPLVQQLDDGEQGLDKLQEQGKLQMTVPYFMKGTTYDSTIMLCDEAEDLTEKQIKLIGTRVGKDSRIFLAGDYKQSLLTKQSNNPLIKMCNELKGNNKFACIYLGEDVRSETSKMFADLFEQ
jgi:PhoH-like ATPase